MIKVLNLYAGIGGNRKLWQNVEVTAVEIEPEIAAAYKKNFPEDKVIVGDAHKYLLEHYEEFDFIWSSPPCPTHSKLMVPNSRHNTKLQYPDMTLYQEIILLKHFFKGLWVVENTKSYYMPLIKPYVSGSHFFWSNFFIDNYKLNHSRAVSVSSIKEKQKRVNIDIEGFSFRSIKGSHKKDKVLNNCVEPKLGLYVFNCAFKIKQSSLGGFS